MAKITRKNMKIFGTNAGLNQRGVIGSLAAGSIAYSTDPETIQGLSNYTDGWYGVIVGNNSPAIQDMNALCFLYAYQLAYLFQAGVAEWNSSTTYYIGSYCQGSDGVLYQSLVDNNLNHDPTADATRWDSGFTIPVGGIIDYAADAVPPGFLACDGSAVSRTTYARLFGVIGTLWGTGDGSTTFNVPDFKGRVTMHAGVTYAGVIGPDVGDVGGEGTHILLIAEMPSHDHTGTGSLSLSTHQHASGIARETGTDFAVSGNLYGQTTGPASMTGGTGFTIGQQAGTVTVQTSTYALTSQPISGATAVAAQGGGTAFNLIQPSAVVIKLIKY